MSADVSCVFIMIYVFNFNIISENIDDEDQQIQDVSQIVVLMRSSRTDPGCF